MFVADYERVMHDVETDFEVVLQESVEKAVAGHKKELSEAHQRIIHLLTREKSMTEKMAEIGKVREGEKAAMKKKLREMEVEVGGLCKEIAELRKEKGELVESGRLQGIRLVDLREQLRVSDEELGQSLEAGYNACLAHLVSSGVDVSGHGFNQYCLSLNREDAVAREKAGNAP